MKRILSALFVAFCGMFFSTLAQPTINQPTLNPGATYVDETRATTLREIEQLKQVISNDPNVTSYFKLGSLYNGIGQWSDAAAAFAQATALKLDHAESYYELGWDYSRLGKNEDALMAHQRLANLKPKDARAWFAVGWDCYNLQRYEEAIAAYQKALAITADFAGAYYEMGRSFLALGKREEANEQIKKLEEQKDGLAGLLRREVGRAEKAAAPVIEEKRQTIATASANLRPQITYKEHTRYTEAARQHHVQGTVLLSAVFTADGRIADIRILRGLPMGLSEEAVKAVEKIRFTPASKDSNPVSVRMSLEFSFNIF